MSLRTPSLVTVVLFLCGCPQERSPEPPARPLVVDAGAVAAAPAPVDAGPAMAEKAEVEIFGNLDLGKVKSKRVILYVSPEPCAPLPADTRNFGKLDEPVSPTGKYFIEIFVAQGTSGHVCAVALDAKDRVIAQAAAEKNPFKMEGAGEVMFQDVTLALKPVPKPQPTPSDLLAK